MKKTIIGLCKSVIGATVLSFICFFLFNEDFEFALNTPCAKAQRGGPGFPEASLRALGVHGSVPQVQVLSLRPNKALFCLHFTNQICRFV